MLIVQKYGGTSVGSLERILNCAKRCLETYRQGHKVVTVVSAMSGETNRLIGVANELTRLQDGNSNTQEGKSSSSSYTHHLRAGEISYERELDQLVSTGEQVSAALVAMAVQSLGGRAVSLLGHQMGILTDGRFTNARITKIASERIFSELNSGKIVVCAGFQGIDECGNITTLGRGGTDTSAVALAAAMGADVCEILTDVDGVYTSDPRMVSDARKLNRISHEEMLELASVGAKVLHIRSVQFAMNFSVPVHVRSSFNFNEGTWIVDEKSNMEALLVAGIALDRNEAKITMTNIPDVPGSIAAIFGKLGNADIIVDMIIQNASRNGCTDITFTVPTNELARTSALLKELSAEFHTDVEVLTDPDVCKISIVGAGMRTHAGVAAKAFAILAAESINVHMVSTSEIKVSVVIEERYGEQAVRALHRGFGLGTTSTVN